VSSKAKPKGHIRLNEATWIKTPPELVRYVSRAYGVKEILTPDEWRELLINAVLKDVVIRIHKVLYFYIRSPAFRRFIKEALSLPKDFFEYWGYGIYVRRK